MLDESLIVTREFLLRTTPSQGRMVEVEDLGWALRLGVEMARPKKGWLLARAWL